MHQTNPNATGLPAAVPGLCLSITILYLLYYGEMDQGPTCYRPASIQAIHVFAYTLRAHIQKHWSFRCQRVENRDEDYYSFALALEIERGVTLAFVSGRVSSTKRKANMWTPTSTRKVPWVCREEASSTGVTWALMKFPTQNAEEVSETATPAQSTKR